MRRTYVALGYLVSLLVVVQASMIVWGISGLFGWIDDGALLDKATLEERGTLHFTEEIGFAVHGMSGMLVFPVLGLLMLLVSLFTREATAMKLAGLVFVLILIQQQLGFAGPSQPIAGALHGINALLLFSVAGLTARAMSRRWKRAVAEGQQAEVQDASL